jgi:predicted acyltransferase
MRTGCADEIGGTTFTPWLATRHQGRYGRRGSEWIIMPAGNQPGHRWRGLDAFRGLAVIGMLLVNNPGNHDAVYSQLEHSAWNGCTIADLVFPFFLFVVGITTTISLDTMRRRGDVSTRRIWRRAAMIFGIGVLLNWFPFYQSGSVTPLTHVMFVDRILARLLILRLPGVLQRIAVAYLAGALIARHASSRTIAVITAALLVGYWALLTLVPVPGEHVPGVMVLGQPARTITAHVDRAVLDWTRWGLGNHLWDSALTWDPEGLLSTLPSIATVLLGVTCERFTTCRDSCAPFVLNGPSARSRRSTGVSRSRRRWRACRSRCSRIWISGCGHRW